MQIFKSKRLWIALVIVIAILFLQSYPYIVTPIIFLCAFIFTSKTIQPLKNYKFWIVIILLVIIVPIFTGVEDRSLLGIDYSSEQLHKTLFMALRGISIFLLFQVLTIDLSIEKLRLIIPKFGVKNFEILYGISNEIRPQIGSILKAHYNNFRNSWKLKKSFELVFTFFSDTFNDFFQLSDQLSSSKTKSDNITPSEFFNQNVINNKPKLIVLTGREATGKTHWISQLIKLIQENNNSVDGLISIKNRESDVRWQHELKRISTNEMRQFTTMDDIDSDIKFGKFNFYQETIYWGNEQLKSMDKVNWIIVDEIGPLEFDGAGLLPGLQSISENFTGILVISLRNSLVQRLDDFITKQLPIINSWQRKIIELY